MWDRGIGQKDQRLFVVGTPSVPLYLYRLDDGWALFEGGLAVMSGLVLKQLREIVGDFAAVRWWFINHAHYDHCALVPRLISHFPRAEVFASEAAAKAFRSPRAQQVVAALNQSVAQSWRSEPVLADAEQPVVAWEQLPVRILADGECLPLCNGVTVQAFATPGHSRCSMSYFLEPAGLLIVSDALGEIFGGSRFLPLIFDDAGAYRRSLQTLAALRPRTVGLGHHGILTGALAASAAHDAATGLEQLQDTARRYALRGDGGMTTLADELTQTHWHGSSEFLPRDLHHKSMVRMLELLQ